MDAQLFKASIRSQLVSTIMDLQQASDREKKRAADFALQHLVGKKEDAVTAAALAWEAYGSHTAFSEAVRKLDTLRQGIETVTVK